MSRTVGRTVGFGWEDAVGAVLPDRDDCSNCGNERQPMGRDWGYFGNIYYDDDELDGREIDSLDRDVNPVRWWEQ